VWRRAIELPRTVAREFALATQYTPGHQNLLPGNHVELLIDGAATFPRMLDEIAAARDYVHFETYIWEPDKTGTQFAEALCRKAREGVKTRVIIDSFGSSGLPWNFIQELKDNRVELLQFRPLRLLDGWKGLKRLHRRNHRKTLIIDGMTSFCGGINISDQYIPVAEGGKGWRDTHLVARGPVTGQLDRLFWQTWHGCGGRAYPLHRFRVGEAAADRTVLAAALPSDDSGQRSTIRRHYIHAIDRAEKFIFIANAYFVPSRPFTRHLCKAARRGVEVRLLLPNWEHNDVAPVQLASQRIYAQLMNAGVKIHQWPFAHMHAKTALVDGIWSIVGSYNLDALSLFQNHEVVIEVVGELFGGAMVEMFRADFHQAAELNPQTWADRGALVRLGEDLAYRFRRFL